MDSRTGTITQVAIRSLEELEWWPDPSLKTDIIVLTGVAVAVLLAGLRHDDGPGARRHRIRLTPRIESTALAHIIRRAVWLRPGSGLTAGLSALSSRGDAVLKQLFVIAISLTCLGGTAMAQDAGAVIASAQKALGGVTSVTYSGAAKDVAFQQCGANAADMNCRGTHHPKRPISNYVRVIDLTAPASRHTGATNNIGAGGSTTVTPGNVLPAGHASAGRPVPALGQFPGAVHHAVGVPEGRGGEPATASRRNVNGKDYTVLTLESRGQGPLGQGLRRQRLPERAEPRRTGRDLAGREHHGRHAHRRHLLGLEGLWRRDGAGEDCPDARRLAVLRG